MSYKLPRGIRNCNPGNIRHSEAMWQGLVKRPTDPDFCQFETPTDGLRALMRILLTYYRRHGLNTVRKIIGRWAPPNENNTDAYITMVAESVGVLADDVIDVDKPGVLVALSRAIVRHENGKPPGTPWDLNWWFGMPMYVEAAKRAREVK